MNELVKWMERNKNLYVITGMFGLLVSPFLWPFFLAILFQSLEMTAPILLAWLVIKQPWKEKEETNEKIYERMHDKKSDSGNESSGDPQTDPVSENRQKEVEEPVTDSNNAKKSKETEPEEEACLAISWYKMEGRERFLRLRAKLETEGRNEFSINRDGICTIRQEQKFLRVGILRGYPGSKILHAEKELKKDGFLAKAHGDYIWISWKKGGF